jgi:hypothetical protein
MPHHPPLLATIAAGIGLAFILGLGANRLRLSTLVDYLVAGIVVGPFTPGFVADQALANELAEIGVIGDQYRPCRSFGRHFLRPWRKPSPYAASSPIGIARAEVHAALQADQREYLDQTSVGSVAASGMFVR